MSDFDGYGELAERMVDEDTKKRRKKRSREQTLLAEIAALRADNAKLRDALLAVKTEALKISDIAWGWDGDCGADRIESNIEDIVDAALESIKEKSDG